MGIQISNLLFALSAGLFSVFSPCSYALLPGYISYYLGSDISLERAVQGGASITLGLLTVYTIIGVLAATLGSGLRKLIPTFDLIAAALLIIMGFIMISPLDLSIYLPIKPVKRKGYTGIYLFGLIYGLAGVGCSAPIFLSILIYAMSMNFIQGVLSFSFYAIGMGIPLVVTNILVAQAKNYMINKFNRATPIIKKISGTILILTGLYLIYYYIKVY